MTSFKRNRPLKAPSPNAIALGWGRVSTYEFWGAPFSPQQGAKRIMASNGCPAIRPACCASAAPVGTGISRLKRGVL